MNLESLISLFPGSKFSSLSHVLAWVAPILEHLEENYQKDDNARDALIDTLIQILQAHKSNNNQTKS